MVLIEFAMTPTGKGDSFSPYVARILDVIDRSGVTYQLTPMGTILEGSWDEVMKGAIGIRLRFPGKDLIDQEEPGNVGRDCSGLRHPLQRAVTPR